MKTELTIRSLDLAEHGDRRAFNALLRAAGDAGMELTPYDIPIPKDRRSLLLHTALLVWHLPGNDPHKASVLAEALGETIALLGHTPTSFARASGVAHATIERLVDGYERDRAMQTPARIAVIIALLKAFYVEVAKPEAQDPPAPVEDIPTAGEAQHPRDPSLVTSATGTDFPV